MPGSNNLGPFDRICLNCGMRFRVRTQYSSRHYCCRPCYYEHIRKQAIERAKSPPPEMDIQWLRHSYIKYLAKDLVSLREVSDIDTAVDALYESHQESLFTNLCERIEAIEEDIQMLKDRLE